ncbi:MAG TPA: pseudouridine synthase, partial [Candidatus Saccharimonadales bacterium]|nr:pseudouridine synthase [Candidatus Saccharimonadales bacterium]
MVILRDRMLIAFNKPYGVLSQFTPDGSGHRPLAEFHFPPRIYPIGRLDADSEGLLLLSDEAALNAQLLQPRQAHGRVYWAQVEGIPTPEALRQLSAGLVVQGRKTLPCRAWLIDPQPDVPPRNPPIRFRKTVPDRWLGLELIEGKNRQVRRMTAAVGHPTLRLLRVRIGNFELTDLPSGNWRILGDKERALALGIQGQPSSLSGLSDHHPNSDYGTYRARHVARVTLVGSNGLDSPFRLALQIV